MKPRTRKQTDRLSPLRTLVMNVGHDISEGSDWSPHPYDEIRHITPAIMYTFAIYDGPDGGVSCFHQFSTPEGLLI